MPRRPSVIRTLPALRRAVANYRSARETVALVPTMGALHRGHLALVKLARRRARRVVVSIFVNPAQFAPHEDFASYPRSLASDLAALTQAGADLVWAPSVAVMYPNGFCTRIELDGPAATELEDRFRPHFFGGVATVVCKLFTQVQPDYAVFGQKDYQQLQVVTQLARDLDLPLQVIGGPTIREPDGLALSSRNAYLTAEERARAPVLYRALRACAHDIGAGMPVARALSRGREAIVAQGLRLDYLEARDARTLLPVDGRPSKPLRLLVAAHLGRTRLIDNIRA